MFEKVAIEEIPVAPSPFGQIDLRQGWDKAREAMERQVYSACGNEVPGDTHRNLNVDTAFSQMLFRHVLLPLWIAAYQYNNRTNRFLVNGQTGEVQGEAPLSGWKIAFAVLAVIVIGFVLYAVFGKQ